MQSFFNFLLLLCLPAFFDIIPQIRSSLVETTSNGVKLNLEFKSEPYALKNLNGKPFVDYARFTDESTPGSPALPKKNIYIAIPPGSTINVSIVKKEFSLLNNVDVAINKKIEAAGDSLIVYKESLPDLKYFSNDVYPSSDINILGYTWIRDFYCAAIQINTHSYNWKRKELKEITGIELNVEFLNQKPFQVNHEPDLQFDDVLRKVIINYDHASEYRSYPFRSASIDSTGSWIDYTQEYIKLSIPENGIYRITYNDLVNYGLNPAGVNPSLLKIFYKGKQIPLYVKGAEDFSFNQNDFIEFYAEKNYGSPEYRKIVAVGEDYLNYMDRYNDTSFIWLSWTGSHGLRTASIDALLPGINDTLKSHIAKLHFENDQRLWYYDAVSPRVQLPFWQENKVWTWLVVSGGSTSAFNFNAEDFVPNSQVKTYTRLISNAANIVANAHSYGSSLNSAVPEDTIFFNFEQTVNFSSTFSSNLLIPGENIYRVFGFPTLASFQQALIDWVDIDFFRWNKAQNDSLLLIVPDSVQSSVRAVIVSNISGDSNLIPYKIRPVPKRITSYNFSGGTFIFTDTIRGGDAYLFINKNQVKTPGYVYKKQFINLRNSQRGADYIIISNKELGQSAADYRNFIAASYPVRTELIFIDDIFDEFAYGNNDAEAVKLFLMNAAGNWESPMPSYLNIIGDANYDYKRIIKPVDKKYRKNLVPSFGNPVSDVWFVCWDSLNINIPQMYVGRIPAADNDGVYFYMQKHQAYLGKQFNEWNKHYLFFSGGDITDSLELRQIRQVNENLLNNVVKPAPVGGSGVHFYKTINPPANLGPYSQSQISEAIGEGGLFISYIGHSGTQTWDNGIIAVSLLKNNYNDRNPLITDFGCSTGKFAEPDIDAFGELFILSNPDGQAISYCSNSSWGYLSTSLRFPDLFYRNLLLDTVLIVGKAHLLAKIEQFNESGYTEASRVFNYCNFLFGDPIIQFKTPVKTNFSVSQGSFEVIGSNPSDQSDSAYIKIKINNFGRVTGDSLDIFISDTWQNQKYEINKKIPVPLFVDSITASVPVKGKTGEHNIIVELDKPQYFDELNETDNAAGFKFTVYSTSVRPVEFEKYYASLKRSIRLLNPVLFLPGMPREILLSVSSDQNFLNAKNFISPFDTIYTEINIDSLSPSERYWWRARLNGAESDWSEVYSFRNFESNFIWYADYSFGKGFDDHNVVFDSLRNSWKLNSSVNTLSIHSAGSTAGKYASVIFNGMETLPNTTYWGIATAEMDTFTLEPKNFRFFVWSENSSSDDSLIAYLSSLADDQILIMTVCDDAAQSVLGFSKGTPVRRAIEGFGSLYIDTVGYRDSWCMIGKKGATAGSVPEAYSKDGPAEANLRLTKPVNYKNGILVFPKISNSAEWISFTKKDSLSPGSSIDFFPIGIKSGGQTDTLPGLILSGDSASLANVNHDIYPELRMGARFSSNEKFESPSLSSIGVNFKGLPELGINYQAVSLVKDTVEQGEDVNLSFYVVNAGGSAADSFDVSAELIRPDNSRETIFNQKNISLSPEQKKLFNISYNTSSGAGLNSFYISIDGDDRIKELYEDNNFYSIPFFIESDTTKPSLSITFDGAEIFDGEYISSSPDIKIELSDASILPINDTSSAEIELNGNPVYYNGNKDLSYRFNPENPKAVIDYKPVLADGNYVLKVRAKDAAGNFADSMGIEKKFSVSNELEVIDAYNYPNPFSGNTYFTFKLTQIPDELKIKIYTVAGRLVKHIEKYAADLKFDFNRLFWDGKDQDGDYLANGVYFYKIILKKGSKTENITRKIAIIR